MPTLRYLSIAQASTNYGPGVAQSLIENCGNTLTLGCSASEGGGAAQYASRLIGEREVVRRRARSVDRVVPDSVLVAIRTGTASRR